MSDASNAYETLPNEQPPENDRPPRNKARLTFTIALWLIILLLIVVIFTPVRAVVFNRFLAAAPTPTATLVAGDDIINITAPPLGIVTIDGHAVSKNSMQNTTSVVVKPIILSRGQHKIVWQAPPFLPLTCIISVPPLANEQCSYESTGLFVNAPGSRLITFNVTMADLPATQQAALKHTVQAALNSLQSTETVQPGEQYVYVSPSGLVTTKTATQPLQATLHVNLDTNPAANRSCDDGYGDTCTNNGQSCLQFCTNPAVSVAQPKHGLALDIIALSYNTWTYTTLNGQIVAQNQPDTTSTVVGQDHSIELRVTWDSKGWHVSPPPYTNVLFPSPGLSSSNVPLPSNPVPPACTSIHNLINSTTPLSSAPYIIVQGNPPINVVWGFAVGTNEAAGCLGVVVPAPALSGAKINFKQPAAYFLYRFGTLLALNSLAHKDFPDVPMVDPYEQSIAQSIVGKLKY